MHWDFVQSLKVWKNDLMVIHRCPSLPTVIDTNKHLLFKIQDYIVSLILHWQSCTKKKNPLQYWVPLKLISNQRK